MVEKGRTALSLEEKIPGHQRHQTSFQLHVDWFVLDGVSLFPGLFCPTALLVWFTYVD